MMTTVAVDKTEYFALEFEEGSSRYFLSIPVSNRLCDYEEYYEIDEVAFEQYRRDPQSALPFVQRCRDHLHDDLLLLKPGSDRGEPRWPKGRGPASAS
jgi:hypothetical protein